MEKQQQTWYVSQDNRYFRTEEECLHHEKLVKETNDRINNLIRWPDAELELLIKDLIEAKVTAFNPNIIDTMSEPQYRAVYYMKCVCQRFVNKHKDLTMI